MSQSPSDGKKSYRTKHLVRFVDVVDGIVLEGFRLFSAAEYLRWRRALKEKFPARVWVGGTHFVSYDRESDYLGCLLFTVITERKYNYLKQQFGQKYGNFPNL